MKFDLKGRRRWSDKTSLEYGTFRIRDSIRFSRRDGDADWRLYAVNVNGGLWYVSYLYNRRKYEKGDVKEHV